MYLEYCNYNRLIDDYDKERDNIFEAIDSGVNGIAMPVHLVREMREYVPDNVLVSAPIDYPLGISSTKVREHMAINTIHAGVTAIDYVPNHYFFKMKFTELKREIETILRICDDNDVLMRVLLSYQDPKNIPTICKLFSETGIEVFFPTIGYHRDDFFDNLINCNMIRNQTACYPIFNGYVWKRDQFDFLKTVDLFGIRLYNTHLLV